MPARKEAALKMYKIRDLGLTIGMPVCYDAHLR
jgi:hypothetical protein